MFAPADLMPPRGDGLTAGEGMDGMACERPVVQVRAFLSETAAELRLRLRAGAAGLDREIFIPRIQKPGLALAGFLEYIHPGRVQILGQSEITFLEELTPEKRRSVLADVCRREVACFVITKGLTPPPELVELSDESGVPLLVTRVVSSELIEGITLFLEEELAPRLALHGVFLDVYGLGVLLLGESGVGKSEAALELVVRGHKLVSDDMVEIRRIGKALNGAGPELSLYHMELRGLGLINIKDLFGVAAVRQSEGPGSCDPAGSLERRQGIRPPRAWKSAPTTFSGVSLALTWRCRWLPAAIWRCSSRWPPVTTSCG